MKLALFLTLFATAWIAVGNLPVLSGLSARMPILALLGCGMLAAWGANSIEERTALRRRTRAQFADLAAVDSPDSRGKLGAALLAERFAGRGQLERAAELLASAAADQPERAEWRYRLGQALMALRRPAEATEALAQTVAIDEAHAYGDALLELARAHSEHGAPEDALTCVERFERNHGERPESAYLRGLALRKLERADEARAAFEEVGRLAEAAPAFKAREAKKFARLAKLARLR